MPPSSFSQLLMLFEVNDRFQIRQFRYNSLSLSHSFSFLSVSQVFVFSTSFFFSFFVSYCFVLSFSVMFFLSFFLSFSLSFDGYVISCHDFWFMLSVKFDRSWIVNVLTNNFILKKISFESLMLHSGKKYRKCTNQN